MAVFEPYTKYSFKKNMLGYYNCYLYYTAVFVFRVDVLWLTSHREA